MTDDLTDLATLVADHAAKFDAINHKFHALADICETLDNRLAAIETALNEATKDRRDRLGKQFLMKVTDPKSR